MLAKKLVAKELPVGRMSLEPCPSSLLAFIYIAHTGHVNSVTWNTYEVNRHCLHLRQESAIIYIWWCLRHFPSRLWDCFGLEERVVFLCLGLLVFRVCFRTESMRHQNAQHWRRWDILMSLLSQTDSLDCLYTGSMRLIWGEFTSIRQRGSGEIPLLDLLQELSLALKGRKRFHRPVT